MSKDKEQPISMANRRAKQPVEKSPPEPPTLIDKFIASGMGKSQATCLENKLTDEQRKKLAGCEPSNFYRTLMSIRHETFLNRQKDKQRAVRAANQSEPSENMPDAT